MKSITTMLAAGAILAAVALSPYGRDRWEFYRLTGSVRSKRMVEALQSPIHIENITDKGLLAAGGKVIPVPGVTNLSLPEPLKHDITSNGVEVAPDGAIYALVRVHHWCGNDPVKFHLARVNLSSLTLLIQDGVRFSDYGFNPAYLPEAKLPWPHVAEELRTRSAQK